MKGTESMKKKILTLSLVVCLAATAIVGGTLAYFTDTEGAKNVMTTGNVDIIQDETDKNGNVFVDGQKLLPVTGTSTEAANSEYYEGNVMSNAQNWIDKIVTVYNDGSENAYVRTLIAFQMLEDKDDDGNVTYMDPIDAFDEHALDMRLKQGLTYKWDPENNGDSLYWPINTADEKDLSAIYTSGNDYTYVEIDGKLYCVAVYYYTTNGDSMLKPNERTHPSLVSIGLESTVTNEQAKYFENYEILVVSQAVQTAGFTDVNGNGSICDDALNTAFGAVETVDQATLQSWFANAK